jgi:hypothetical protein
VQLKRNSYVPFHKQIGESKSYEKYQQRERYEQAEMVDFHSLIGYYPKTPPLLTKKVQYTPMHIKKQLTLAWTLVAVLAVLLAIAGYFLANPTPKESNISAQKDVVRESCSKTDQASKDICAKELQDMSDMLREFSATLVPKGAVKIGG